MNLFLVTFLASIALATSQVNDHNMLHPTQRPLCVSQLSLANYACGRLGGPPSDPNSPAMGTTSQHGYVHGHRHRQGGHESPYENCCRWLNDLDDECVCDLLVRLPAFLAGPVHEYTVVIGSACRVSYRCNGRGRA